MIKRLYDSCTFQPSDPTKEGFANDNPPEKRWYLMGENYNAARRALYAARAQLG